MATEAKARVITPMFRMNFTNLDVPKKAKDDKGKDTGEPKFSLGMIFTPDALTKFKKPNDSDGFDDVSIVAVCQELTKAKWPGMDPKTIFAAAKGGSNWPIKKGEVVIANAAKKAAAKNKKPNDMPHLVGMFQISASAKEEYAPALSYKEAGKTVELSRDNPEDMKKIKKLFQGGNYAIAEISIVAQETNMGNFLSFYLNHVQFRKEGERIGGNGQSLMNRFDGIDGGETDFDPSTEEDFGV